MTARELAPRGRQTNRNPRLRFGLVSSPDGAGVPRYPTAARSWFRINREDLAQTRKEMQSDLGMALAPRKCPRFVKEMSEFILRPQSGFRICQRRLHHRTFSSPSMERRVGIRGAREGSQRMGNDRKENPELGTNSSRMTRRQIDDRSSTRRSTTRTWAADSDVRHPGW